ncbi:MAG: TerC family protein [Flavobacteriales bacterium]|nr:TerC family protein [Flavobacteriales bacterium]
MEIFLNPDSWIALLTLTFLEIVLGIDNIIFISIVAGKLPKEDQRKARLVGLTLALVVRIILLMGISWLVGLTEPVLTVYEFGLSWRDIILVLGGLFLISKSTTEIHHKVSGEHHEKELKKPKAFSGAIIQIILLDIIFSFDSILTAVGLTNQITLMVIAVIVSILVMMLFAGAISNFVNKYETLQVLALSFLILIGFMLVVEGAHIHVPKGYIYFAVFFSLIVEAINIKARKNKN